MVYSLTLDGVRDLASRGNLVPVYREIPADMETPVTAYLKVAKTAPSFLLESVEGGERLARYSFIGTAPYRVLRTGPDEDAGSVDPLTAIESELSRFRPVPVPGLPRFLGGAVGFIAYDAVRHFEPRLPEANASDPMGLPESMFLFSDTLLAFDHVRHTIKVISHVHVDGEGDLSAAYAEATARIDALAARLEHGDLDNPALDPGPESSFGLPVDSNHTPESFRRQVQEAKELITAGECIQVVLSQRLQRPTSAAPFDIYRALRAVNPSPYMYFLQMGDFHIIGSSPELLVRVEDGIATTHPIAGTTLAAKLPRRTTP